MLKLYVLMLALGFSAQEKLNRGYLPPPGARFAGGSSLDLQTPLEYPKEIPIYEPEQRNNIEDTMKVKAYLPSDKTIPGLYHNNNGEIPMIELEVLSTLNENFHGVADINIGEIESIVNPIGYAKDASKTEFGSNNLQNISYKNDGSKTNNEIFMLPSEVQDNNYEPSNNNIIKPNMIIVPVSDKILQNYMPKYFGMYGGNPTIIKSNTESLEGDRVKLNYLPDYKDTGFESLKSYENLQISSTPKKIEQKAKYPITKTEVGDINIMSTTPINSKNLNEPKRIQAEKERNAAIVNFKNVLSPKGYSYSFDTSNGIHKDEIATTIEGVKAVGSYSYTGDDGKVYSMTYTADENGFQPIGDHLPTPPPISVAIQKVIEQAKKDQEAGIIHDGSYDEEKNGHMKYQGPINRYLHNKQQKSQSRNYEFNSRKDDQKHKNKKLDKQLVQSKNQYEEIRGPLRYKQNENTRNARPISSVVNQQNIHRFRSSKPSVRNNFDRPRKMDIKNKQSHQSTQHKDQTLKESNGMKRRKPLQNLDISVTNYDYTTKQTTPIDTGYLYVPPSNVFIEGRFQDKAILLQNTPKTIMKTQDDTEVTPMSIIRTYTSTISESKIDDELPEKHSTEVESFISTTEVSLNKQMYGVYGSTYRNMPEPMADETRDKTIPTINYNLYSNEEITTNYPNTPENSNTQEFADIALDTDTLSKKNDYEMDSVITRDNNFKTGNFTTPMPSQTEYTNLPLADTFYNTTNPFAIIFNNIEPEPVYPTTDIENTEFDNIYNENKEYSKSTTEISNIFESTTDHHIYVDGFGRPIPNKQHDEKTNELSNVLNIGDNIYNLREPLETTQTSTPTIINGQVEESDKEKVSVSENTEQIIGEDFSGPRQPQSYDPKLGYFYWM